jgi:uncharacterized membrane protein
MKKSLLIPLLTFSILGNISAQVNSGYIPILLPSPVGVSDCGADDINDSGMILGGYSDDYGFSHLLAWTNCLGTTAIEIYPPEGYQFTAISGLDVPSLDSNGNIACFVSNGTNNNNTSSSTNQIYPCFFQWNSASNTWSPIIVSSNRLNFNDSLVLSPSGQLIASLYGDNQIVRWQSPLSQPVYSMPTSILYPTNKVYSDVFYADDSNHVLGDCSTNNSATYQGAIWDLTLTNSFPIFLSSFTGSWDNQAHAINHNGWVVGWANSSNPTSKTTPILWTNTSTPPLALKIPAKAKLGLAFSINDSNQIVGLESNNHQIQALLYNGTNMTILPLLKGYSQSGALKINNNGFTVGAMSSSHQSRACIWAPITTPIINFVQPSSPVDFKKGLTITLITTSSSGGRVSYTTSNPKIIGILNGKAIIKGKGTVIITARVAPKAYYTSAVQSRSLTIH